MVIDFWQIGKYKTNTTITTGIKNRHAELPTNFLP